MKDLKRDKIIRAKIENIKVSLKDIAEKEGVNYDYARKVWAKYKRELVTKKGSPFTPFPFMVQNFGYFCHGPTRWFYAIKDRRPKTKTSSSFMA